VTTLILAGLASFISVMTFVASQLAQRQNARLEVLHALEARVLELEEKVVRLEARERELLTEKMSLLERLVGLGRRGS